MSNPLVSEAEALNALISLRLLNQADGRRRDGDFLHGQLVGAAFVLDRIGAPTRDGCATLTVGQRIEAYLALSKPPASAPPREPSHCEGDHHVWSDRFGDDWTPDVGTPCDCRAKQWSAPQ